MGTKSVDPSNTDSVERYKEFTKNYEDMQTQAWTSKDVSEEQLNSFEEAFDTYISTSLSEEEARDVRAKAEPHLTAMHAAVELEQQEDTYSDSAWEDATRGFDSILADLAPEGAEPASSQLSSGAADEDDEVDGTDEDYEVDGADEGDEVDDTDEDYEVDGADEGDEVDDTDEDYEVDGADEGDEVDDTDEDYEVDGADEDDEVDETDDGEEVRGASGGGTQYGNNADYGDESDSGDESDYSVKGPTGGRVSGQGNGTGVGWGGADLTDPASSKDYKGMSLEQLMADEDSIVGQQLRDNPDIVAAIQKVSAETGVPEGLLAAMCTQESNFNNGDISGYNDGYADMDIPQDQMVDAGVIQAPLWAMPGSTTAEKRAAAMDPYNSLKYFADEAVEVYGRTQSWGSVLNNWYTGNTPAVLDGAAAGGSSETGYVVNVLDHLGMGGAGYKPGEEDE